MIHAGRAAAQFDKHHARPFNARMPESKDILVEVDKISRSYGNINAVRDVSFTLRRGEVLGFLGPNGAGKSTTMKIISGTMAPGSGRVRIVGHDIQEQPLLAKRAIGYLPEFPPLYRELTVNEYLDYTAALRRIPRKERRNARESAKEKCGLGDVGHRLIGNLSKGYQQRVGLAQAIVHLPPVIILDEPTAGLDPIQIREVRELMRSLGRDHAVVLSTHILSEVQASCDRVQIINKGELVLSDTIANLTRHLTGRGLRIGFRQPADLSRLESLPGVTGVTAEESGHVRVFHSADTDPTEAIVQLAATQNWGLYEINGNLSSLEDLFVELTGNSENGRKTGT